MSALTTMARFTTAGALSLLLIASVAAEAAAQEETGPRPGVLEGDACVDFRGVGTVPADTLRAIGDMILEELLAEYGRSANQLWNQRVSEVIGRIERAVHPDLRFRHLVVNSPEWNAGAVPNGYIVVFAGLLEWTDRMAAAAHPNDASAREATARRFLAAVLAHEIAHHTMGHTGPAYRSLTTAGPDYEQEMRFDEEEVEYAGYSRGCETEADRAGGLYMLWAGWEIQDAIDLWELMDAEERRDPDFHHVLNSTFARSHPRGTDRIASLEILRGELKRNQTRFDDAIALIDFNVQLDDAIALLDRVITDFPHLPAARHARGTAYHRKWLNTVPIQTQQVRADLMTLASHFAPQVRGMSPGERELLERALADYQATLEMLYIPETASHAALLEAYLGRTDQALRRSAEAVSRSEDVPGVLNNHGVVLFLADRKAEAAEAFRQALEIGDWRENPVAVFNLGKTLTELGDPSGEEVLVLYTRMEDGSAWEIEAHALLGHGDRPSTAERPGPSGGRAGAPAVRGVRLSDSPRQVMSVLGSPDEREGDVWAYHEPGVVVSVPIQTGVEALVLLHRGTGEVEGIRVGDPAEAVIRRLGQPHDRSGSTIFYGQDGWFMAFALDAGGMVERMAVVAFH